MATLHVYGSYDEAREAKKALPERDEAVWPGVMLTSCGYNRVVLHTPVNMNPRVENWFVEAVVTRLRPGGEIEEHN
jgi:hypothetical protein